MNSLYFDRESPVAGEQWLTRATAFGQKILSVPKSAVASQIASKRYQHADQDHAFATAARTTSDSTSTHGRGTYSKLPPIVTTSFAELACKIVDGYSTSNYGTRQEVSIKPNWA